MHCEDPSLYIQTYLATAKVLAMYIADLTGIVFLLNKTGVSHINVIHRGNPSNDLELVGNSLIIPVKPPFPEEDFYSFTLKFLCA